MAPAGEVRLSIAMAASATQTTLWIVNFRFIYETSSNRRPVVRVGEAGQTWNVKDSVEAYTPGC
jgi:hypothetical protein